MEGDPEPLATYIACLDYGFAKLGGKLVTYRWEGEKIIRAEGYVCTERTN